MNQMDPRARARQQAEHRLIVQATMQANRTGKLPRSARSATADIVTLLVVLVVVFGMLFLVMRQGG